MLSRIAKPRLVGVLLLILLVFASIAGAGCAGAPSRGWSGPAVVDNVLYVGTIQGKILALDLATAGPGQPPDQRWDAQDVVGGLGGGGFGCTTQMSKPMGMYGTPAVKNGKIYIGAYDGNVLWVATDGTSVSRSKFKTGGPIVGSVAIDGDTLYVGSSDGKLYALDLNVSDLSNSLKDGWPFETGDKIWSTPVISNGVVYITSADHNLYAIDAASGNEIWRFETEAAIMSTPLVVNGKVYVGGGDWKFYAIVAATEDERLAANARGQGTPSDLTREPESVFEGAGNWFWTQALLHNGEIWVGNLDHKIYVLNAANVAEEVHEPYSTGGMVKAPPVLLDGFIVVGSQDGKIYAINPATKDMAVYAIDRETEEVAESGKAVKPLPPIFAPMFADTVNGILYFHAQNGTQTIYAFKLATQEVLWSFRTDKISD